ncbi:MAG: TPM domain-containing protein [Polyangiaceae bacterium]
MQALFLALGLLLVSSRALAAYVPPALEGPVTDPGRVLSESDRAAINAKLRRHKESTGVGINVFIPKSLEGQSIEDVAYDTARAWKLGTGGTDEGVLFVWAPNERKTRIETAKGIGDRLTDVETFHIQRDIINPKLKAGQNRQAIEDGVDAIAKAIGPKSGTRTGANPTTPKTTPGAAPSAGRALAGGALFLIIVIGGGGLIFVVLLVVLLKKIFSGGRRDPSYYSHHHDPYVHNQNDYGTPGIFYSGGSDNSSSDWGGGSSDSGGGGSDWGGGGDSGGGDWGGGGSSSDY